jgi:hypothetical protein
MAEHKEYMMRDAFDHLLSQFKNRQPTHALFTSFTFSSSFFENNVLPLLCGESIDDIKGATIVRDRINEQLATINTVVVCDRSAFPEPKGNLRYGLMTVGMKKGRFHPKLILMAGTLVSGQQGLWLAVGSGNLTHSGWAIQREVVGTTPITVQHGLELAPLLSWLLQEANNKFITTENGTNEIEQLGEEGNVRNVLRAFQTAIREHAIPDQQNPTLPTLHLALPQVVLQTDSESRPGLLSVMAQGEHWDCIHVVSPFWGGVPDLMATVNADKFFFAPSLHTNGYSFPPLPPPIQTNVSYLKFAKESERYTHAKAILFKNSHETVLCIGSANFTTAALLHGVGQLSNIEAMLSYKVNGSDPWAGTFDALDSGDLSDVEDPDEGAPSLPEFDADVIYDWQRKEFRYAVKIYQDAQMCSLTLEVGAHTQSLKPAYHDVQCSVIAAAVRHPVRTFLLTYSNVAGESVSYRGLVTQVGAKDDDLGYSPPPRLDMVLELLHGLDPKKGDPRSDKHNGGKSDDEGDENGVPDFDFFSFFLATDKMRKYYNNPQQRNLSPFAPTPSGIPVLYRAVTLQNANTPETRIGRYVQLAELSETIAAFDGRAVNDEERALVATLMGDIKRELTLLEADVARLCSDSKHFQAMFTRDAPPARAFLTWFRNELKLKDTYS